MGEVLRVLPEKFQYSPEMLRETEEKLASITQLAAACTAPAMQLALFDALHDDRRPSSERTAAERYHQPGLFETHAGATQGQRPLTSPVRAPTLASMEIHLTPELQAKLDRLASETGREKNEFVLDAMAGYFDELAQVRETLDSRYDDLKSGKVKPIPGDEIEAYFAAKSAAHRSRRP